MRPEVTEFDKICRCRNAFTPACQQNPVLRFSIWKLADTFCLFRQNVYRFWRFQHISVGTNTFLPGIMWTDSIESMCSVQIGTRFEWAPLFQAAECPHSMESILPYFHGPLDISWRTPTITILSAFEPVESRTQAQGWFRNLSESQRNRFCRILSLLVACKGGFNRRIKAGFKPISKGLTPP
jgi:hypothetical protein